VYRKEALEARDNRSKLHGNVFLVQPVRLQTYAIFIAIVVSLLLFTLMFGSYPRSELVLGHIRPSNGISVIRASRNGQIKSIEIKEGDTVKKGQLLFEVVSSEQHTYGGYVNESILNAHKEKASLLNDEIDLELKLLKNQITILESNKKQSEDKIEAIKSQIELQKEVVRSSQLRLEKIEKDPSLKAYVSDHEFSKMREEWLKEKLKLSEKIQIQSTERASIIKDEIKLKKVSDEWSKKITQLKLQIIEINTEELKEENLGAYGVFSSVDGIVSNVLINEIGTSIKSSQPLVDIIVNGSNLYVELFIPNQVAGFVESGQRVKVMYDAFPYQKYGAHNATIDRVAGSVFREEDIPFIALKSGKPVYRATAQLKKDYVDAHGKKNKLQYGMTLKASIVLEKRSYFEWISSKLHVPAAIN